ncbi:MAG: mechanosensitive ion channel family protein [Clostridia bacterium]|nr:mechanosensitive ion channel family protein [Clostridia bacterium]MBR0444926.1 mechanosensitive ion channel family protein [Clostridia bacterium]
MEDNNPVQNEVTKQLRRKANFYFFSKVWFNFLLIVVGTLLLGVFLSDLYSRTALSKQEKNSQLALSAASDILERNFNNADALTAIYHEGNQKKLDDIDLLLSEGLFVSMTGLDDSIRTDIFRNLASRAGIDSLYLMSLDGKIILSQDQTLHDINPSVRGYLTQENINQLLRWTISRDKTITPVLVKNQFGTFFFYSKPVVYQYKPYALVIGTDASVINNQFNALEDVSAVLSRISVINDGFLFAADSKSNLLLYYKHGDSLLTGRSAESVGLSKDALTDGYSGTETILGQPYYCFSKTFGDSTVLCAATRTSSLNNNRNYVLFWPLFGFVLVMVICLAYAVIIRNDFVRNAVKTNRFVIFKGTLNPLFFDRSVFAKVLPLIFLGVLAVFGISFYTQTLLEITGGIAESEIALQEVSGRYESGRESRQVIEDYYNSSFLSTARLLSFIIEEDPDILNGASEYYHSVYDENGKRQFLSDDEGNPLKSISKSAALQKLCDSNGIDAIYLFDESGHTIATSTSNWFFTLSHNEEDQSYPFLQVLSGEKDHLVQTHMTNDLGEDTQYFGVDFHYYTTKDEAGNTVYVSRSEYEQAIKQNAGEPMETGNAVTRHSSLLQIELDKDVAGKLLTPTSVESVLSTTMLNGGGIVMFDSGPDHECLYSPIKASIGKTAEELDISPQAFKGLDYYGFSRINGITYFQYFCYLNDYFFATAIPKSGMFTSRTLVSVFTAGACFLLILILILSVTITSKDEETLYENMSDEQAEKILNSPIFSIMLPSGRRTSTQRAAARWDNKHIRWSDKGPEQKLATIFFFLFCLLLLFIVFSALGYRTSFNDNSVIRYIFSGAWDRSPNIFALSACALVLTGVILIIVGFRIPVRIITSFLGTRGETVGRLLLSIIKYGCTIAGLFYCLYLLGVDSPSLLASAGILSLVIGLGAQSLIKDILAGIFIVFEGEFRVGDIVTINDFRGTVMDIGLRTTKIMAPGGNIKIYNNSEISGVLNMTKEASVATCTISIEYGQDIDYVEAVLNRDLPLLKKKNPQILDGPNYAGVSNLGSSGVDILILCKCYETDIRGVTRYLNKEILQIFYRNGINVPFPNVTVSNLDMTGRKTIEDFAAETAAEEEPEGSKQ